MKTAIFCLISFSIFGQFDPDIYGENIGYKNVEKVVTQHYGTIYVGDSLMGLKQPNWGTLPGDYIVQYDEADRVLNKKSYKYSCGISDTCKTEMFSYQYLDGRLSKRFGKDFDGENVYDRYVNYEYLNDSITKIKSNTGKYTENCKVITTNAYKKVMIRNFMGEYPQIRLTNFDTLGRPQSFIRRFKGELKEKVTYFYQSENHHKPFLEQCSDKSGNDTYHLNYVYNEKGDLEMKTFVSDRPDSHVVIRTDYEYDYDKNGNWTELRIKNRTGRITGIIKKTISYRE